MTNMADLHVLYPTFVMHKRNAMSADFNDRLYELCKAHYFDESLKQHEAGDIGYLADHARNIFRDIQDPVILEFARMAEEAAHEYLRNFYNIQYRMPVRLRSQPFYQDGRQSHNAGMYAHTHHFADLVITYYPRIRIKDEDKVTPFHAGTVRFYDPSGRGNRTWNNENPVFRTDGCVAIEPQEGSLIAFEGHAMHDSSHFAGQERMCVPIMVNFQGRRQPTSMEMRDIEAMYAAAGH